MKADILGVGVDRVDRRGLIDRVAALVESRGATVAYANVHVLNVARADEELKAFLNAADLCYCDGDGVRLGAWILGDPLPERMTGADWIWDLASAAEGTWRLFWIGGGPGVVEAAAARLRSVHPRLEIGGDHGFHDDPTIPIARANAFGAHIVLVGMGTPMQERWVARHRDALDAPVVWVVGATADFVSGRTSRGPAWLHTRQEWLARLLVEPGRLWRRYLFGNVAFLTRVLAQRLRRGSPRP